MKQDQCLRNENKFTYRQAFHLMFNYLNIYRSLWGKTDDLDNLIQEIKLIYQSYNIKDKMWQEWFDIANEVILMQDLRVQKEIKTN